MVLVALIPVELLEMSLTDAAAKSSSENTSVSLKETRKIDPGNFKA